MNPSNPPEETVQIEKIAGILNSTLPTDKYANIRFMKRGGTRLIFCSEWGPGKEKRVIKVDTTPKGLRAARHVERGYDTENELRIISGIKNNDKHHLMKLYDFYHSNKLEKEGFSGAITVEEFFEGKTLEEIVSKRPLKVEEFESVFTQVLEAEKHLIGIEKIYHRDLNKGNIMIREEGKSIEAKVNDYANACRIGETSPKAIPTAGSMCLLDPLLAAKFRGEESSYNEKTEMYQIGVQMFYSLTGREPFEYNPDEGTATSPFAKSTLLNANGTVDREKHEKTLETALKTIPKNAKKYREVLRKCLTLKEDERYDSIEKLAEDFEKVRATKLIGRRGFIIAGLAAATGIAAGAYSLKNILANNIKSKVEEANRYEVAGVWDGGSLEVSNNLVDLNATIYDFVSKKIFPKDIDFIKTERGTEIGVSINISEVAWPRMEKYAACPPIEGKIYLEGFEGKEFAQWPEEFDKSPKYQDAYRGSGYFYGRIKIPEDMPDGVYTIAVELYAPANDSRFMKEQFKQVKFMHPGRIMKRKRIPLVVGEPRENLWLSSARISYDNWISFRRLEDHIINTKNNFTYEFSIPKEGLHDIISEEGHLFGGGISLPDGKSIEPRELQAVVRNEGKLVNVSYLPIKREVIDPENPPTIWWALDMPGREFSEKIIEYRKKLFTLKDEKIIE